MGLRDVLVEGRLSTLAAPAVLPVFLATELLVALVVTPDASASKANLPTMLANCCSESFELVMGTSSIFV